MKRYTHLKKAALAVAFTSCLFTAPAHAVGPVNLNLQSINATEVPTIQDISYFDITTSATLVNDFGFNPGSSDPYTFNDVGIFQFSDAVTSAAVSTWNGSITAVLTGQGHGTSNTTTAFYDSATLNFYYNPTHLLVGGTGSTGTNYANAFAAGSTTLATFELTSGFVSIEPTGAPSNNSIATLFFKSTFLNPAWQTTGSLPISLLFGVSTTNTNILQTETPTLATGLQQLYTDTFLAAPQGGISNTSTIPTNMYISANGQFRISQVPEPASLALLGLGFLGMSATRRSKHY